MELNRAGNPLQIYWDFNVKKSDGIVEAFPLEGKPLRLTLITPRGKKEIKDFKAHGNVIEWLFSAQYQTTYGDHSLLLEVLSPTGKVLSASDQCKFIRIVDKSCMSSDNDIVVDGETKTLTLSTEMSVVRIMPVVPEVGENGNWWVDGEDTGKPSTGAIDPALRVEINNKADKTSLPTKTSQLTNDSGFITKDGVPAPDWNASTYKEGHIKNRTHHMQDYMCYYFKGSPIKISKPSGVGYVLLTYDTDLADKLIRIEINANESKTHEFLDAMGMPIIFRWDAGASTINVESFGGAVETYSMRAYYSSSAKGFEEYFIALDEGFIPEGVARKSDIATINGKPLTKGGNIVIGGGSVSDYVADFCVEDLDSLVEPPHADRIPADIDGIVAALQSKSRILIPYEVGDGYALLVGYTEDLLYAKVISEGKTYVITAQYGQKDWIAKDEVSVSVGEPYDDSEIRKDINSISELVNDFNEDLSKLYDTTDEQSAKLTELAEKVNELDKGEAYIMGDILTFRNWADASIEGETLKL